MNCKLHNISTLVRNNVYRIKGVGGGVGEGGGGEQKGAPPPPPPNINSPFHLESKALHQPIEDFGDQDQQFSFALCTWQPILYGVRFLTFIFVKRLLKYLDYGNTTPSSLGMIPL
jgi:hypothetical protein